MKFKVLLLFTIVSLLFSCESNENLDVLLTESDLIGTWNVKEQTMEGNIEIVFNGQTQSATYNAFAKNLNMTLNFADSPKKASANGSYTLVATSNFNGQTETEEEYIDVISDISEDPTWALIGNNITLSNDYSLPQNLMIESYNGTTLRLKAEIDETETDNGQSIALKTEIYLVLEK